MQNARLIVTALFCLSPFAANADAILTGDWEGHWEGSGITAVFDMSIEQDEFGLFEGHFDWTCTSGITCSGIEYFVGFFDEFLGFLAFATIGFEPGYVNLGPAEYAGFLLPDGDTILGFDNSGGEWYATRVPEPGTLALLGLGLLGLGLARRRRLV